MYFSDGHSLHVYSAGGQPVPVLLCLVSDWNASLWKGNEVEQTTKWINGWMHEWMNETNTQTNKEREWMNELWMNGEKINE